MRALIVAIFVIFVGVANANPVPEFPFIILTEHIEKKVKPDVVKIRFSFVSYDKSSEKSLRQLKEGGKKIAELLKKHGIPIGQLESTQIDKRAKRARQDGAYNLDILGYETTQGFRLALANLEKYTPFMNDLIEFDGVASMDAFFESTQEEKYKQEMISELSAKAREKADTLASAQSKKVKGVYGITTEGTFGEAYAIFSLQYEPRAYALAGDVSSLDLTLMVPEFIQVNQRMTVIYELK